MVCSLSATHCLYIDQSSKNTAGLTSFSDTSDSREIIIRLKGNVMNNCEHRHMSIYSFRKTTEAL